MHFPDADNVLVDYLSTYVMASIKKLITFLMQGLVTKQRKNLDAAAAPFAKDPAEIDGLKEGATLVEVVSLSELLEVSYSQEG